MTFITFPRRFASAAAGVTPRSVEHHLQKLFPITNGIRCHEVSGSHTIVSQAVPSDMIRPGGFISGPFQFSMADLGMWVMSWGKNGIEAMSLTSELSIRFVRPARGSVLWARVDLNAHAGRNIISTATLWATEEADGTLTAYDTIIERGLAKPCSVAQGTYVVPRT